MALSGRGFPSSGRGRGNAGKGKGAGIAGAAASTGPGGFELCFDASIRLETLHEDEHVLAVSKPAGVLAHPSPGFWGGGTVAHALVGRIPPEMLEERGNHGEWDSFIPRCVVHRLDAGTTGVMLIAKSPVAEKRLTADLRTADAPQSPEAMGKTASKKVYVTLLLGNVGQSGRETCITVDGAIGRDPLNPRRWAVVPGGKHARSVIRVHGYNEEHDVSLVTVELFSGRTHQIRVHCANVGAPVASDDLYAPSAANVKFKRAVGSAAALPPKRQLLHAWALDLPHPVSGGMLSVRAPVPSDIGNVIRRFWPDFCLDPATWPGIPARLAAVAISSPRLTELTELERLWLEWWESSPDGQAYARECQEFFSQKKRRK